MPIMNIQPWGRVINGWTIYLGSDPEKDSTATVSMKQVDKVVEELQEKFMNDGWTMNNMRPTVKTLNSELAFCHLFMFHRKMRNPLHIYVPSDCNRCDISVAMNVSDYKCYSAYAKQFNRRPNADEMLNAISVKLPEMIAF